MKTEKFSRLSDKMARNANTDGLINCLRQPGQLHYQHPKSMILNLLQLIKPCGTRTDPAAETESIGLPADSASWRMVPCFLLAT